MREASQQARKAFNPHCWCVCVFANKVFFFFQGFEAVSWINDVYFHSPLGHIVLRCAISTMSSTNAPQPCKLGNVCGGWDRPRMSRITLDSGWHFRISPADKKAFLLSNFFSQRKAPQKGLVKGIKINIPQARRWALAKRRTSRVDMAFTYVHMALPVFH